MSIRVSQSALGILLAGSAFLSGCAPLLVGSVVTAGVVATDRRTSGTQVEDQAIELKAANAYREHITEGYHISTNSYNRHVLLTGEVPTPQDRTRAQEVARQIENVRSVRNELVVGPSSTLSQRSNDLLTSSKVRSRIIGTENLPSNSLRIHTERGVVYLRGLVTRREAALSTEVARTTSGVQKVVQYFEFISEEEAARQQAQLQDTTPVKPYSGEHNPADFDETPQ